MTSSGHAGKAPRRHSADADVAPSAASPEAVAGDGTPDTPDTTAHANSVTGPPDDVQELRQEIEETRERLGETVQQLAAKTDVKARAQNKAAELTHKVKATAGQARTQAAARAGNVRGQVAGTTGTTGQKALSAATAAREQVSGWLVTAGKPAWQAAPEPVRQAVAKGASSARQRRTPLLAVTAALLTGYVAIRWWRRR